MANFKIEAVMSVARKLVDLGHPVYMIRGDHKSGGYWANRYGHFIYKGKYRIGFSWCLCDGYGVAFTLEYTPSHATGSGCRMGSEITADNLTDEAIDKMLASALNFAGSIGAKMLPPDRLQVRNIEDYYQLTEGTQSQE